MTHQHSASRAVAVTASVLSLPLLLLVIVNLNPGAVVIVAVSALLAMICYLVLRIREDNRWDRDGWGQLERIGPELVGQVDEAAILRVALADATTVLRCSGAEVLLYPHRRAPGLVAEVSRSNHADQVEVRRWAADQQPPPSPATDMVVPLFGSGREIGLLSVRVENARGQRTRRHLAGAFAHLLASSLGAVRMYEAQRRLTERAYHQALQDGLTSLGNRSLLSERGNQHLTSSTAGGSTAALLVFDLDDFKRINDTLGHEAGDRVLTEVGRRVKACVRDTDLAVRLGGDEFAVLTGELNSSEDAENVADRILEAMAPAIPVADVKLAVGASVGIAVYGEDGDLVEELLRAADRAMYEAKAEGGGHWRRAAVIPSCLPGHERALASELRRGLPEQQLVVHYQPQVDAIIGEVTGFEALVRWQHPELGLLLPDEFVPLAERSGLMRQLTSAVLDRALADLQTLQRLAPGSSMGVNISSRNLLGEGLLEDVQRILTRHEVPAEQLTLEITEPAPPSSSVTRVLAGLEGLGCRVSIHEFGTGHSSLTLLSHYPSIREIKIASGLAGSVVLDRAAQRLVRAIVSTAHALDVRVVAEGVESAELVTCFQRLGCDILQGHHVQEPAPLLVVEGWLARWPDNVSKKLPLISERSAPDGEAAR